jgi:hypothetical protein
MWNSQCPVDFLYFSLLLFILPFQKTISRPLTPLTQHHSLCASNYPQTSTARLHPVDANKETKRASFGSVVAARPCPLFLFFYTGWCAALACSTCSSSPKHTNGRAVICDSQQQSVAVSCSLCGACKPRQGKGYLSFLWYLQLRFAARSSTLLTFRVSHVTSTCAHDASW